MICYVDNQCVVSASRKSTEKDESTQCSWLLLMDTESAFLYKDSLTCKKLYVYTIVCWIGFVSIKSLNGSFQTIRASVKLYPSSGKMMEVTPWLYMIGKIHMICSRSALKIPNMLFHDDNNADDDDANDDGDDVHVLYLFSRR